MKDVFQIISIAQIPKDYLFEGYYWYSNQHKPILVSPPSPIQAEWFSELPFVVEGNFYDSDHQLSIQIRNIDGQYVVAQIDLRNLGDFEYDRTTYIGHDLEGKQFQMIEAWKPQADELLEGMKTLKPVWSAFAGFVNHQNV
jgi:CRISPR type III-associated protein (TIGR04423 family)